MGENQPIIVYAAKLFPIVNRIILHFFKFIYFGERAGEGQRERERENPK